MQLGDIDVAWLEISRLCVAGVSYLYSCIKNCNASISFSKINLALHAVRRWRRFCFWWGTRQFK